MVFKICFVLFFGVFVLFICEIRGILGILDFGIVELFIEGKESYVKLIFIKYG